MDTLRLTGNVNNIEELRREAKILQKNGLPYIGNRLEHGFRRTDFCHIA